jgi:sugar phosphate permease
MSSNKSEVKKCGILKTMFNIFKEPAPSAVKIQDPETIRKTYIFWRVSIFINIYILYFVSYLSRKNLSVAMSPMSHSLGISNTDLGILGSIFYITYCIGKFTNGILADKANVRVFLPFAIAISGLASAGMAFSAYLIFECHVFGVPSTILLITTMSIFWGLNGWFQSAAFPLCGKSLTFWFSNKERDIKWSWWSTSHEIGSSAALVIVAPVVVAMGWKGAFYVPAAISLVLCIASYFTLRDKPTSIGLPEIEEYQHTRTEEHKKIDQEEKQMTYGQIYSKIILRNKNMWLLGAAFIFVYILRFGPMDWFVKYFIEVGKNSVLMAAFKTCFIPLFGSIGTLTIPYFSDKLFGGRRAPANFSYLMLGAISLLVLRHRTDIMAFITPMLTHLQITPSIFQEVLDYLFLALLGIGTCGPLVMIGGICSIESTSKKVAAAATGFTGAAGYIGAIFSSIATGRIIDLFGFDSAVDFWMLSAVAGALLCIPLWKNRSRL